MKFLWLLSLIFSPFVSAKGKPITVEQYQALLIKHAVSMNTYEAGMSFLYKGGTSLVPIPGKEKESCKGKFQSVDTILLVGPSNDYFLLEEDTVTFDENQECRKYFENGRQVTAKISLEKFKPLTVHELGSLKNNIWKGIYQLGENKVIAIGSEDLFPEPMPMCPEGSYELRPILNEFNGAPDPDRVVENHIDLSRPRDFRIYKRIIWGEKDIYQLSRIADANLEELNKKYKHLKTCKKTLQGGWHRNCVALCVPTK